MTLLLLRCCVVTLSAARTWIALNSWRYRGARSLFPRVRPELAAAADMEAFVRWVPQAPCSTVELETVEVDVILARADLACVSSTGEMEGAHCQRSRVGAWCLPCGPFYRAGPLREASGSLRGLPHGTSSPEAGGGVGLSVPEEAMPGVLPDTPCRGDEEGAPALSTDPVLCARGDGAHGLYGIAQKRSKPSGVGTLASQCPPLLPVVVDVFDLLGY